MSNFTTQVRYICEVNAGLTESVGFDQLDVVLSDENVAKLFKNITYPIFDEKYRSVLNKKILEHFYTREIGFETVGLWKLKLRTKLTDIMPYYNQLYKSELLEFNPLYDVDLTTTRDTTGTGEGTVNSKQSGTSKTESSANSTKKTDSTSTGENTATGNTTNSLNRARTEKDLYNDTPQGGIDGLESGTYLTNARIKSGTETGSDTAESTSSGTNSNTFAETGSSTDKGSITGNNSATRNDTTNTSTTEHYLETVAGKNGGASYSTRLKEFRETFINIDLMVMDELQGLFMGLWE